MLKANYHTHMKYCKHAEGMVIDYVKKAIELNFEELGMSDHAPILKEFMTNEEYDFNYGSDSMSLDEIDSYLNQIEECRKKFPNIKIYSGFETEYLYDQKDFYIGLSKKVDYLNLGLHFYKKDNKVYNCYEEMNYSNLNDYYEAFKEAIELGIYTCFVHPDIFMFNYKDRNGNRVFDDVCENVTRKICELAVKNDIYLEINANGFKYSVDKYDSDYWLYPCPKFWEIAKEYPVKVVIGCDAHEPDALYNENVQMAIDFAKIVGIKISKKMVLK